MIISSEIENVEKMENLGIHYGKTTLRAFARTRAKKLRVETVLTIAWLWDTGL